MPTVEIKYPVIPADRVPALTAFCEDLIKSMTEHCKKHGFEIYVSQDGISLEVVAPNTALRDGYEYVALISAVQHDGLIEGAQFEFEICELIDEDQPGHETTDS